MSRLHTSIERCLAAAVFYGRLAPILRALQQSKVPILVYHSVSLPSDGEASCLELSGSALNLKLFRRQMEYIAAHYETISLEDFVRWRSGEEPLPKNPCVLTFDDGLLDVYENVVPILQELSLKATFFIIAKPLVSSRAPWLFEIYKILDSIEVTACVAALRSEIPGFPADGDFDKAKLRIWLRQLLDSSHRREMKSIVLQALWSKFKDRPLKSGPSFMTGYQVKCLNEEGFEIGCHSVEHEYLSRLSDQELDDDIHKSKSVIWNTIGRESRCFCYPFGEVGSWDDRVVTVLRKNKFVCACTTIPGLNDCKTDLFALRRIGVGGEIAFSVFVFRLLGLRVLLEEIYRSILKKLKGK